MDSEMITKSINLANFVANSVEFLKNRTFDGLCLDWHSGNNT